MMAGLGYVTVDNRVTYDNYDISTDESISGMLFDYGLRPDPFGGFPSIKENFGERQIALLTSLDDADEFGIDDQFLSGVPYYHISQYFEYAGNGAKLYVMFADCSQNFDAIQDFQYGVEGKLFQLGVWTERCLWKSNSDGNYEFTSLVKNIQLQAEELGGRVGVQNEAVMPLSIVLCANTAMLNGDTSSAKKIRYRDLPYGLDLDCPRVSVVLGQNGTDEVHNIQANNVGFCPVGFLGLAMACLYLASAEISIGEVQSFNLNKNNTVNNPELGFGSISTDLSTNNYTPISNIVKSRANIISKNGYILPTTYEGKEAEVFFSNDQTMSDGDYSLISLNRVMNKCRRVIRGALLPYLNSTVYVTSEGNINESSITIITNEILEKLDAIMVSGDQGNAQILGRNIIIDSEQNILESDGLTIEISIIPANTAEVINATEDGGNEQ